MWQMMESERALIITGENHNPEPIGNYGVCCSRSLAMKFPFVQQFLMQMSAFMPCEIINNSVFVSLFTIS